MKSLGRLSFGGEAIKGRMKARERKSTHGEANVSVLIPVYNAETTLERCLDSIMSQNIDVDEILVVDDCSPDRSVEIARRVTRRSGAFRIVQHNHNWGLSATLNDGLRIARGDYVLILQQDCVLLTADWIKRATSVLERETRAVVSGFPIYVPSELSEGFRRFIIIRNAFPDQIDELEKIEFSEFKCDLLPRSLLDETGGFPEMLRVSGEDQAFSHLLRSHHYKIIRSKNLPFMELEGNRQNFLSNLKKEFVSGSTQMGIFFQSGRRALDTRSRQVQLRLVNRITGAGSMLVAFISAILLALTAAPHFALMLSLSAIFRWGQLFVRTARRKGPLELGRSNLVIIPFLGILSDLIYVLALFLGAGKLLVLKSV